MILRPHSLETFKPFQQNAFTQYGSSTDFRKKIQNFSFLPNDKIGRGYSSIVYKGQNDITKQPVAIKVIELKSLRDQNTKRFLQNQLECLRKLNHQNNLKYINSFITSNNCYIITELYPEGDLSKILKQKIRFTEIQAFEIFNQFYQGYLHFHFKGYIHRDIKPSNVLIQKKGSRLIYAIADFGFVKKLQQHPKDSFNVGTPVYMPPQSISSNIYTTKSDIWSMGVMLFELVYGYLPFSCKNQTDLKRQICNKQIKLEEIQESLKIQTSYEFKSFLLNCLRKNPQNRIELLDMKQHQWFRKRSYNPLLNASFQNNVQVQRVQPSIRKPKISISKEKVSQQNKYGFIGNQAIRRQKSIQGNNPYSLKNYFKNPERKLIIKNYQTCNKQNEAQYLSSQKQNISFNIGMIKQKFNQIDLSVEKHNEKAKTLGLISNNNFTIQGVFGNNKNRKQQSAGYLIKSTNFDSNLSSLDNHNQSMKNISSNQSNLFSPLMNKTQLNTSTQYQTCRSSLLEGMKSVVNLKNNQISKLKIDSENNMTNRSSLIKKQSFLKRQLMNKQQQISTSIDDSTQRNSSSCKQSTIPQKLSPIIEKKFSIKSQQVLNSPVQKIQPHQFILKFVHILRYIFQTLTIDEVQINEKYTQARSILSQFLGVYLLKLKRCLLQKQNIFNLQNWVKFTQSDKYNTFKEVIEKYYERYSMNPRIHKVIRQCLANQNNINSLNTYRCSSIIKDLFNYIEQITNLNRQTNKKSTKNNPINSQIILIYNYYKCLQIVSKVLKNKKNQSINDINAQKDFQQLTTKNKDPFKIPKILIQLKKKLIYFQSSQQSQKMETIRLKSIKKAV